VAAVLRQRFARMFLAFLAGTLPFLPVTAEEAPTEPPQEIKVILLGTGYPRPDPDRAGPATAVVIGEKIFIVDVGRGVTRRFWATGLPLKNIHAVFLTHLHSDHVSGLPDLFNTSWIFGRYAPFELYGPEGTRELAQSMLDFFAVDIPIRREQTEMHPGEGATVNTHILEEGVVYEDADLRVTAFRVDHQPVEHAFGFSFDLLDSGEGTTLSTKGGCSPGSTGTITSVVISGDTRPSENLIKHAKGADLLIHEAYLPEHFDQHDTPEVAARLKAYHTSAVEVGQVAQQAGVPTLVLTHLVPGDPDSEKLFVERAARHFKGKIIVGRDLMEF
jgi:ribonuclease Z